MKRTKQIEAFIGQLEEIIEALGEIQSTKQDSFDNKSERFQESEKGEEMQQFLSYLEDAINEMDSAKGNLENAFGEE